MCDVYFYIIGQNNYINILNYTPIIKLVNFEKLYYLENNIKWQIHI